MANFTGSKQQFANDMQSIARQLLLLAASMDNLNSTFTVHKFDSGDTNAFVDLDFNAQNVHLTAQIVFDVMFAIGTIVNDLTPGIRNSLRECILGGLP